jgi:hypothetical protein
VAAVAAVGEAEAAVGEAAAEAEAAQDYPCEPTRSYRDNCPWVVSPSIEGYNEGVSTSNDFESLRALSDDVLAEIVREGETRVLAQLQIATAADQRALTFAGFLVAAATAALGGGIALMKATNPDPILAAVAFVFAFGALIGSGLAMVTVWPRKFAIPGNEPINWLPAEWRWQNKGFSLKEARVEQACCLQEAILKNQRAARKAAELMHWSMYASAGSVAAAGLVLLLILALRYG